jgi:hypothetical protein
MRADGSGWIRAVMGLCLVASRACRAPTSCCLPGSPQQERKGSGPFLNLGPAGGRRRAEVVRPLSQPRGAEGVGPLPQLSVSGVISGRRCDQRDHAELVRKAEGVGPLSQLRPQGPRNLRRHRSRYLRTDGPRKRRSRRPRVPRCPGSRIPPPFRSRPRRCAWCKHRRKRATESISTPTPWLQNNTSFAACASSQLARPVQSDRPTSRSAKSSSFADGRVGSVERSATA